MPTKRSARKKDLPLQQHPRESLKRRALLSLGKPWEQLLPNERFQVVGWAVRDYLILNGIETEQRYRDAKAKRVYYLSMEFLMGRSLTNNLVNLGIKQEVDKILEDFGADLERISDMEPDAALGNGGLGRLAACFLDSLATLSMPGYGYGINYEYGLFRQEIHEGQQVEKPDSWLRHGTPWEILRPDEFCLVKHGGEVRDSYRNGEYHPEWVNYRVLVGEPYDMPIVGYGGKTVNTLRLFSARASREFDMHIFNEGDYIKAVQQKMISETVSKVLYPNDQPEQGQALRLMQEYFLVACALEDIFRDFGGTQIDKFPDRVAIHLNDTHPALTVPELMRILLDGFGLPWTKAWNITTASISYTNHTLLPEALEKWPVELLGTMLPRHLQIIYEINRRFLDEVAEIYPGDDDKLKRMSIIEEEPAREIRMANLSIIGSHSINGVAAVHTDLVKRRLVPDFYALWPKKFNNKTNGVTPRRWILSANPALAALLTEVIGDGWITDLAKLADIEKYRTDKQLIKKLQEVKKRNKRTLAEKLRRAYGVSIDPDSVFDVQVKRIHEYKRQLLNAVRIVHDYMRIVVDHQPFKQPRTYIFSGKAAPGYHRAKDIIYLIHKIADVVNHDPASQEWMRVVFIPNYSVTVAEDLIPASDVSEQISTAGFEASGTGNMKFAMNGALTIGTLDGANIEMAEEIGDENMFIFGNTVEQIADLNDHGVHPRYFYDRSDIVRRVLDVFKTDRFCQDEPGRFSWVFDALVEEWDPYFHLADLEAYLLEQQKVDETYHNQQVWAHRAVLNIARMGKFSSDRTIREYATEVWNLKALR
jgi:starch phosphorylase